MINKFKELFTDFIEILSNDKNAKDFIEEQIKLHGFKHRNQSKVKKDDEDINFLNCDDKTNVLNLLAIFVTGKYVTESNINKLGVDDPKLIEFSVWFQNKLKNYEDIYGAFFNELKENVLSFALNNFDNFVKKYRSCDFVLEEDDEPNENTFENKPLSPKEIALKYLAIYQNFVYYFINIRKDYQLILSKYPQKLRHSITEVIVNSFIRTYMVKRINGNFKNILDNDPTKGLEEMTIKIIKGVNETTIKQLENLIDTNNLKQEVISLIEKHSFKCFEQMNDYIIDEYSNEW